MDFYALICKHLKKELGHEVSLEVPPSIELGDYAFPCFLLSKKYRKSPMDVAKDLAMKLSIPKVQIQPTGPYLNFFIDKAELAKDVLANAIKSDFGKERKKEVVLIEYSSPNVAKHMGVHNLRSTVIGHALYNVYNHLGYSVKGINYLGDWGTNFGQLTIAAQKWSSIDKIKKGGVKELNRVYVKFHKEAEKTPSLLAEARAAFKALDEGKAGALKFWKLFREVSLEDYQRIYDRLGVHFDTIRGEAATIKDLPKTIKALKKYSKKDDGALIVELADKPPCILLKSDGASTYASRDITTALYRIKTYKPKKVLYVVDVAQKLHFEQVFEVLGKLDKKNKSVFEHVIFGRLSFPNKKMSTRKGSIIVLEDVLEKSVKKVKEIIKEKNPKLKKKQEVSEQIGVGAIIFHDLVHNREQNITFTWEKVLDFEGESGPYVQYAYARACSLLKKYNKKVSSSIEFELLTEDSEVKLVKSFDQFKATLAKVVSDNDPSVLAKYLVDLARKFNDFYSCCQILGVEKETTEARMLIVLATKNILGIGLELLGICHPEEM